MDRLQSRGQQWSMSASMTTGAQTLDRAVPDVECINPRSSQQARGNIRAFEYDVPSHEALRAFRASGEHGDRITHEDIALGHSTGAQLQTMGGRTRYDVLSDERRIVAVLDVQVVIEDRRLGANDAILPPVVVEHAVLHDEVLDILGEQSLRVPIRCERID